MLRKIYKFSYVTGTVLLIVSMLMSIMPAFPVFAAQGSTKTSAGSCANPVNKNHYSAGDVIVLDFQGFEPNSTHNWTITGNPGGSSGDPGVVVASGTFTADANGDWCVDNAYTVKLDDWGEYHVSVEGGKGDNYRVEQEPAPGDLNISVSKTPSVSSVVYPGDTVTFTIVITNNETFDLAVTQIGDSVFGNIGSCAGITDLPAGQSITCSFTGEVTGEPGTNHVNVFTVGATNGQQTTTVSDNAVVAIEPLPVLQGSLLKSANPTSVQAPGSSVTFSVVVNNTSAESISLNSLTDDIYKDITTSGHDGITSTTCATGGQIAAGGSYSCSFTADVSGSAGETHTNTVTAGVSMGDQTDSWSDSAVVNIVEQPVIGVDVTKVASPDNVTEPGGPVTFTFTVTNTSNVVVQFDSLIDNVFGNLDGQGTCTLPATLAVSESFSCEITQEITAEHTNQVDVQVSYEDQTATDSATATVTFTPLPDPTLTVQKTANPTSMDEPGGPATFTVQVTNTSPYAVRINSITDNQFGDLNELTGSDCLGSVGRQLASGASFSCSFTENISGAGGTSHVNTVTVQVIDDRGVTATESDNATVNFIPLPTISITKTASPVSVSEYGGNTTFTIDITNTSNETLWLTSLTDSMFGNLSGQGNCNALQVLAAGASYQCNFTRLLVGEPSAAHENVATVSAEDSDGNPAQDSDNAVVNFEDVEPTISVTKTALTTTIDEPGGMISYLVQVTNDSGEIVTLNSLLDDKFGDLNGLGDCATGGSIGIGATYSCEFSGLVSGQGGDTHTNVVTATASDNDNNSVSASDDAIVTIMDLQTVIDVTKTASPTAVNEPGGDVTFSVTVDNLTGEPVTLTNLVDDIYNDITTSGHDGITSTTCATGGEIAIGDSYSCSFTAAVAGDAGDVHINTVFGTAVDNEGNENTDSDSAQVDVVDEIPTIQVIKLADPTSVPAPVGTVSYSVEVVNNSNEAVTLVSLIDDKFGDLDGAGDCLVGGTILPGESYSCTFEQSISGESGQTHTNVIEAVVSDNEDNETSGTDDAVVTFIDPPQIELVDPCTVGCDQPDVVGEICNRDADNNYGGRIDWAIFVGSTQIGNGTLLGLQANSCVEVSAPRQGNGTYSITATLVDEGNLLLQASCGELVCEDPVDPPETVDPPTGTPTVFIPVTGFDFSLGSLIPMIQNLGFALISVGLVLHGLSLNGNKKKKS